MTGKCLTVTRSCQQLKITCHKNVLLDVSASHSLLTDEYVFCGFSRMPPSDEDELPDLEPPATEYEHHLLFFLPSAHLKYNLTMRQHQSNSMSML